MAYFINRSFSTCQPERAVIRITQAGATWVPPGPRAMDSAGLPSQRGCAGPPSRSPLRARTAGSSGEAAGAECARGAGRAGSSPLKSWTWRAASGRARECGFGQKGGGGGGGQRTMCFLLGTRKPGLGCCFWCRIIMGRWSLILDQPALVAGCRGLLRVPTDAAAFGRRGRAAGGRRGSPR